MLSSVCDSPINGWGEKKKKPFESVGYYNIGVCDRIRKRARLSSDDIIIVCIKKYLNTKTRPFINDKIIKTASSDSSFVPLL